jgi:hypothetical protein
MSSRMMAISTDAMDKESLQMPDTLPMWML